MSEKRGELTCAICGHAAEDHAGPAGCLVETDTDTFCGAPCHDLPTKWAARAEPRGEVEGGDG